MAKRALSVTPEAVCTMFNPAYSPVSEAASPPRDERGLSPLIRRQGQQHVARDQLIDVIRHHLKDQLCPRVSFRQLSRELFHEVGWSIVSCLNQV